MKKLLFISFLLIGTSLMLHAQKSKVIAVFNLIKTSRYEEAKTEIEAAVKDDRTRGWPRTWYARGLLCQTAYEEGKKENDEKKYELYPDQLTVAMESYKKALVFDRTGRMDDQVAPYLVKLANEFLKLGESAYKNENYKEALRVYEYAIEINKNPVLTVKKDTNLIYNAALSAYRSQNWDKATGYFETLNTYNYSPNVPLLLSRIHLAQEDSLLALNILRKSLEQYNFNEELVLEFSDLSYQTGNRVEAIEVLDKAMNAHPDEYIFSFTKGLIYQKDEQYDNAINAYKASLKLAPGEVKIYRNIGICYYNSGVGINSEARKIADINAYQRERTKSTKAFESAIVWFNKALEKKPGDQDIMEKLNELQKLLN